MRYNAFYGELPLEAFKPIGGRMRLYGGGDPISAVTNAVSDAVSGVGDVVSGVGDAVSNIASSDLGKAALVAAAVASANPELIPSLGTSAIGDLGATDASLGAAGAANAGAVTAPVTAGTVAANALPPVGTAVAPALSPVVPAISSTVPLSQVAPVVAENAAAGGLGSTLGQVAPTLGGAALGGAAGSLTGSTIGDLALISGGTGLGSALIGANAAQKAADIQSAAAQGATQLQGQIFNTINQQQAPYRASGYGALNRINALLPGTYTQYDAQGNPIGTQTGTDYLTRQYTPADFQANIDPSYAFRLQQGQMANQRAANVAGGALGGNALRGLQDYTQGLASTEYGNAFNRFQQQRTNIYNTLAGIAGIGQQGQTASNQAATNMANAVTGLGVGSAAAQAAGQVGQAGAYGNALGQLGSGLTLATLLNQRGNVTLPTA